MKIRAIDCLIRQGLPWLLGVNAALTLLWAVAVSTDWMDPVYGSDFAPGAASMAGIGPAASTVSEETVREAIKGKAIFRTNRQVEEKVVDELGRYELRGVSNGRSGLRAYVRDTKRKRTLTKEAGEMLDVFEVVDVRRDGLVLRRADQEVLLAR